MRFPLIYYFIWIVSRLVTRFLFRMEVLGTENIPSTGGFILASNHRSYHDPILVLTWMVRPAHCFAKAELFRNSLFGHVLRHCLAFPVRRGVVDREALAKAADVIKEGKGLVMFPEGTRCKTGDFLPAKPGVGLVAIAAGCTIIPTYLHGSDKLRECLLGKDRLRIRYGKPIEVTGLAAEKENYAVITQQVMGRIREMSEEAAASK